MPSLEITVGGVQLIFFFPQAYMVLVNNCQRNNTFLKFMINFGFEYDDVEYTPTNVNENELDLFLSGDEWFELWYGADSSVCQCRGALKRLSQKLLTFLHASTLKARDDQTKILSTAELKSFCNETVRRHFDDHYFKSTFLSYIFQDRPHEKHEFIIKNHKEI